MNHRVKAIYLLFLKDEPIMYYGISNDIAKNYVDKAFKNIVRKKGSITMTGARAAKKDVAEEIISDLEEI